MKFLCLIGLCAAGLAVDAQQITGVWKGRIGSGMRPRKVELKLVQKGDSIYGTSYYYESANNYKRYSIKGFLDHKTNGVIWWDQALVDGKSPRVKIMSPGETTWLSEADFNCPGDGRMMLDGSTRPKLKNEAEIQRLHFDKVPSSIFSDEWDFLIENYSYGANDPAVIDSVAAIAMAGRPSGPEPTVVVSAGVPIEKAEPVAIAAAPAPVLQPPAREQATALETPRPDPGTTPISGKQSMPDVAVALPNIQEPALADKPAPAPVPKPAPPPPPVQEPVVRQQPVAQPPAQSTPPPAPMLVVVKTATPPPVTTPVVKPVPVPVAVVVSPVIEEKFTSREKVIATEIAIATADSIELRFYDNAEVDGDSISLFLNNQLIFQHIRLTDRPYIVKLGGDQLQNGNELTMVAENLGAIPPNTSYMVAFVDDKRYEATLTSSEKSSAVIRFKRK